MERGEEKEEGRCERLLAWLSPYSMSRRRRSARGDDLLEDCVMSMAEVERSSDEDGQGRRRA